ncbi:MAG: hypothetical protein ABI769_19445 [Pseudomonadota bacterium]
MKRSLVLRAAAAATLLGGASHCWSADDPPLNAQIEALRTAITAQRAQLEVQAKLLEAQ